MNAKRNVSLAIGIGDAKNLSPLDSALNGARMFHDWAKTLGYDATLLTTEDAPVTMQSLRAVLDAVLRPDGVALPIHRFLLYFAGHGMIREAGQGLWLLSDWFGEQRAVAVEPLRRRLSFYDIDQIAIFGDACRSLPRDIQNADITADPVLGRGPLTAAAAVAVDTFIAAQDGAQAYTLPGADPVDDQCLFTGVLLRGLWGTEQSAYSPFQKRVTSASLGGYLSAQVPLVAARYSLTLKPSVSFGFPELDCVYFGDLTPPPATPQLPEWPAVPRLVAAPAPPPPPQAESGAEGAPESCESEESPDEPESAPDAQINAVKAQLAYRQAVIQAQQSMMHSTQASVTRHFDAMNRGWREAFSAYTAKTFAETLAQEPVGWETPEAGIAVSGGTLLALWMDQGSVVRHDAAHPTQWRLGPGGGGVLRNPLPLIAEVSKTAGGTAFVALSAIPGFGAFLLLDAKGAAAVQYAGRHSSKTDAKKAQAALIAMDGSALRGSQASGLAMQLRHGKVASPLLGVIAAYLYDSAGNTENIRRMAQFYLDAQQPIPYDIALLGMLKGETRGDDLWATVPGLPARAAGQGDPAWDSRATAGGTGIVGGRWPWLTQGWAYLDEDADLGSGLIHPALLALGGKLTGARFTTLNEEGASMLADAFGLKRVATHEG